MIPSSLSFQTIRADSGTSKCESGFLSSLWSLVRNNHTEESEVGFKMWL